VGQVLLVTLIIVVPLLSTSQLPAVLLTGILRAPAVPPPPPPKCCDAPATAVKTPPRQFSEGTLLEPRKIPDKAQLIVDEAPPVIAAGGGVIGSVGGPNGVPDGVIGAIASEASRFAPPAPAPPVKAKEPEPAKIRRVRVGGEVQPPILIHKVTPVYPPIARQTRTEGVVTLRCVIGIDGRVSRLELESGHPWLVRAAIDAVRQWRYRPTLLNQEPVEVAMQVDVSFRLSR
jgi:protein TonB